MEFNNTEVAFKHKSNFELKRAYWLFKLLSMGYLSILGRKFLNLLLTLKFPVDFIILKSVYPQFCGGRDIVECTPVIKSLIKNGVYSTLDYSVEACKNENDFEKSMQKCLNILDDVDRSKSSKFIVFKPSSVGSLELYRKIGSNVKLSELEERQLDAVESRFNKICTQAKEKQMKVLIDAEESWIQSAIDKLVINQMLIFNKKEALVFNTVQAYRHDRYDYLINLHKKYKGKIKIGIKLVRGAYMEKENNRANKYGYKSPICKSKKLTDRSFNDCLKHILKNINDYNLFMGSHNEKSNILACKLMDELKLKKDDKRVWFSQLYGMSDNISFNLSKHGYNVAKYLPYGPINEVMPYLIRRLNENSSISSQTNRELQLIKSEMIRRNIN